MTTATPEITRRYTSVKQAVMALVEEKVEALISQVMEKDVTPSQVEEAVTGAVFEVGRELLAALFGLLCWAYTARRLQRRGEDLSQMYVRTDSAGYGQVTTGLGDVRFFWWGFRRSRGGRTFRPAAALFPLRKKVRSSRRVLEVASLLASEMPFRDAEAAFSRLTLGAVSLEDTTLARYASLVGSSIDHRWTYRSPAEIRSILSERATRDSDTGLPLVYASTDAHALTRYVDETWYADFKMINGVRVWCVDRSSGGIIHLGGEYTWGDCKEVADIFARLQRRGILPKKYDYGDGVRAQLVIVTDGARWIEERVLPLFPEAVAILDAYHVLERVGELASKLFGAESQRRRAVMRKLAPALGLRSPAPRTKSRRKGHRKRKPGDPRHTRPVPLAGSVDELLAELTRQLSPSQRANESTDDLVEYLENNAYRLKFAEYRRRGIQIGSGAMESMHRFASQVRLKRSGARWLPETAIALLNLRLVARVERWREYWEQPDLEHQLAARLAA